MKNVNKIFLLSISLLLTGCDSSNNESSSPIINNSETIDKNESNIIDSSDKNNEESNSSIQDPSNDENIEYITFTKQYKIYVNPSVQYANSYADNLGNEGQHMNSISKLLVGMLNEYTNLIVYSNNSYPGKSLSESVKESNSLSVDYHLSLHSNAGGGKGSEGFYTKTSYGFTKSILDSLQDILPYPTRGPKYGQDSLYELKRTTASSSLIEILFHDDKAQALFIINNQKEIAEAIFNGIVSYLK